MCQVDNHLSDGVYPVLVSCKSEEEGSSQSRKGDEAPRTTPFLQISIIKEVNQATNTAHYNYVAFRCVGSMIYGSVRGGGTEGSKRREVVRVLKFRAVGAVSSSAQRTFLMTPVIASFPQQNCTRREYVHQEAPTSTRACGSPLPSLSSHFVDSPAVVPPAT